MKCGNANEISPGSTRYKKITLPKLEEGTGFKNSYIKAIKSFNQWSNVMKNLNLSKRNIEKKLFAWIKYLNQFL